MNELLVKKIVKIEDIIYEVRGRESNSKNKSFSKKWIYSNY